MQLGTDPFEFIVKVDTLFNWGIFQYEIQIDVMELVGKWNNCTTNPAN